MRTWITTGLSTIWLVEALAQAPAAPPPLTPWTATGAPAPWRLLGLPGDRVPPLRLAWGVESGEPVLTLHSQGAYGLLVHPLPPQAPAAHSILRWRWRVQQGLDAADLSRRDTDDTAIKVCALFDAPLDLLPFWERQQLRLARSVSGEPLPSATLCYVWDRLLPAGTLRPNVHSARLVWWVLDSGGAGPWRQHQRRLVQDFRAAFPEWAALPMPPLIGIGVGADADNTGGSSQAQTTQPLWEALR